MNSKGMPPRTSERLIGGSFPFQKLYSGATAVLVDEFGARQLKCPSEHNDRLRPHILSFFLGRIGSFAAEYFRGSRRFGRCGGFCGSRGSGPSKANARLIAICELDTGCF